MKRWWSGQVGGFLPQRDETVIGLGVEGDRVFLLQVTISLIR